MLAAILALVPPPTSLGSAGDQYTISESLAAPTSRPDWSDEFDGRGVDPAKWQFDTSRNRLGWYNGEQQYYGPANATVADGVLTIEARRDPALSKRPDWGGQRYSSAKMTTQGRAAWTYGFVELRAKLPCGGGMWPGLWMMPVVNLPWPTGGEIDLMEQVSSEPNVIHATLHSEKFVHTKHTQRGALLKVPTSCSAFHTYQLRWTSDAITIGVDNHAYFRVTNDHSGDRGAWPFDRPFYLILNLAVGGGWPGPVDDRALPQRLQLDYVRVWHLPGA